MARKSLASQVYLRRDLPEQVARHATRAYPQSAASTMAATRRRRARLKAGHGRCRTPLRYAAGLCCAIFLTYALIAFRMSLRGMWCRRTSEQVRKQCETMRGLVSLLNNNGIENWLCYGSALAATRASLRHRSAMPIPWESDDDLCILVKDAARFEDLVKQHSESLTVEVIVGSVVRMRISRNDQAAGQEWHVDVYAHEEHEFQGGQVMMQNVAPVRDLARRDIPVALLRPLRRANYCKGDMFWLPKEAENYMEHLYGTTWTTPMSVVTSSNGYRRFTCLLSF